MKTLGIDIGGSGIKGAVVEPSTGELITPRYRIPTPHPAKPDSVAEIVAQICQHFDWTGPIGYGFPAVVQRGVVKTAANIHRDWINTDAANLFTRATGRSATVLNDADAAGIAEMRFGAGTVQDGVVFIVTIGTGLGTSVFTDGNLVPNTELGHIELKGWDAERYAADSARKREDLSWKKWGRRFNRYLQAIEKLLWPDLIVLGGGASKKYDKYAKHINVNAPVIPAKLRNEAGMIGAALAANQRQGRER